MSEPVNPALYEHVRNAPVLTEQNVVALRSLHGEALPDQAGTAPYHASLTCVFAAFLGAALDMSMEAKPRRKADEAGYRAELSLIAYTQSVLYLAAVSSNNDLLTGRNGDYIVQVLRARRPEFSRPIDTHLSGGDVSQIGAQVSGLAIEAAERNRIKTKIEPLYLMIAIPNDIRVARESAAEHLGLEWSDLVDPLT